MQTVREAWCRARRYASSASDLRSSIRRHGHENSAPDRRQTDLRFSALLRVPATPDEVSRAADRYCQVERAARPDRRLTREARIRERHRLEPGRCRQAPERVAFAAATYPVGLTSSQCACVLASVLISGARGSACSIRSPSIQTGSGESDPQLANSAAVAKARNSLNVGSAAIACARWLRGPRPDLDRD